MRRRNFSQNAKLLSAANMKKMKKYVVNPLAKKHKPVRILEISFHQIYCVYVSLKFAKDYRILFLNCTWILNMEFEYDLLDNTILM